jgi:hypothetical protein
MKTKIIDLQRDFISGKDEEKINLHENVRSLMESIGRLSYGKGV